MSLSERQLLASHHIPGERGVGSASRSPTVSPLFTLDVLSHQHTLAVSHSEITRQFSVIS